MMPVYRTVNRTLMLAVVGAPTSAAAAAAEGACDVLQVHVAGEMTCCWPLR